MDTPPVHSPGALRRDRLLVAGLLLLAAGPLLLPFDDDLVLLMNPGEPGPWDPVLLFVDRLLPLILITVAGILGAGLWLWGRTRAWRWRGLALALAPLLASRVTELLKGWVGRPRPLVDPPADDALRVLVELADLRSFPSGHVTTVAGFAVVFMWITPWRRLRPLWLLLIPVTMWDRVALAHHFPSDTFAGAGIALSVCAIYRRVLATWDPRVSAQLRGPVVAAFVLVLTYVWRQPPEAFQVPGLEPIPEVRLAWSPWRAVFEPFLGPATELRRQAALGAGIWPAVAWTFAACGLVWLGARRPGPRGRRRGLGILMALVGTWCLLALGGPLPGAKLRVGAREGVVWDPLVVAGTPDKAGSSPDLLVARLRELGLETWALAGSDSPPPRPQGIPAFRWTGRGRAPCELLVYGGLGAFQAVEAEVVPAAALQAALSRGAVVLVAGAGGAGPHPGMTARLVGAGALGLVVTPRDLAGGAAARATERAVERVQEAGGLILAGSGASHPVLCGTGLTITPARGPEPDALLDALREGRAGRAVLLVRPLDTAGVPGLLRPPAALWSWLAGMGPWQRLGVLVWFSAAWLLLRERRRPAFAGASGSP